MKTLSVSYLPRGPRSRTKRLLDSFLSHATDEVEHIDLAREVPPLFLVENLAAYYRRNYEGTALTAPEAALMKDMDRLTTRVESADCVVVSYPMFNLSHPAVVKAWFDAVLQKGRTWKMTPTGPEGLLKGKRALVISSSASAFTEEVGTAGFDHSIRLSTQLLTMMGFDTVAVSAQGLAQHEEEPILCEAEARLADTAQQWYGAIGQAG